MSENNSCIKDHTELTLEEKGVRSVKPTSSKVDDVCERHNLSRDYVDKEIREGRLKARRIGRGVRVFTQDEMDWINSLPSARMPYVKQAGLTGR